MESRDFEMMDVTLDMSVTWFMKITRWVLLETSTQP
jgi:hypothetical protein